MMFSGNRMRGLLLLGVILMAINADAEKASNEPPAGESSDKYIWLEDVHGDRALNWVRQQNERSAKVLEGDPRFAGMQAEALKVLESPDRLPLPDLRGTQVYNTWQDSNHVRGILRRTDLGDYLTAQPHWKTIIDYDELAKLDNEKWVAQGMVCLYPGTERCLVGLSAGGEDASTMREFDLKAADFVRGGFVLAKSKQEVAWIDRDTLLVARDWGTGTMTTSGYPFIVKMWKRGQPLGDAREVFRGKEADVVVHPVVMHDAQGHKAILLLRDLNFFERELYVLQGDQAARVNVPAKVDIDGLLDGQLILSLNEVWQPEGGASFAMGSVVSLDLESLKKDPQRPKPALVFAPTSVEFAQEVAITKNHLVLTTLENVQGRASVYSRTAQGAWHRKKLEVPNSLAVNIAATNPLDDQFFLLLEGYLTPPALSLGDAESGSLEQVKSRPPLFDASQSTVEQLMAVSKDGTHVPYFVVRRKDMKYDGNNPTILNAYGGFQIPITPQYLGLVGKLWIEKGGVYVVANIRGGGEFGPGWHEAGLKTHRQRIYDDFAAVGADLVSRKITSARRLGIIGGSNGGLLMGVEMTQHPTMWNAVAIMIPLLDMIRFEQIAAGASWVGEYGSVANPEEREFLASISPYQQLKREVTYPEPFIFTTTKDDRVGPVHARKFAAKMDEYGKPFLYQEIIEGGHGAGADLKEEARTQSLVYMYFTCRLMD